MNFRDALHVGVALAAAAVDRTEKKIRDLVKSGKLSAGEGRKILEDLRRRGEDVQKTIRERVDTEVRAALKKMHLVVRKDLEDLRAEVDELKRKLRAKGGGKR